ncbi:CvpA family protein [Novosphingobium sp. MMS21-SN21R]|uniref:CvpA family protein n=1 Tax=Novosphingobium sp. MMS21-SN21R TaxID=2969298 RepID=UPI002888F2A7|nr:CvpA family protein [Novosphingobium sp. MMS21-SN21R]MDT0508060.1 CvpA family protein [Novosphingobium sp. MMS21-SN21R]
MTGFDYVVLLLVGLGAVGGFFRGFVEEVLSLAAWCLALLAVHYFHAPATIWLADHLPNETGAGILAFALLLLIPYIATRFVARRMGSASRGSVIGPIDRILGFGFGAVKGFIIVVLGYSLVVFAYDLVWGEGGRPGWITESRTYPFLNAASEELLTLISARREQAAENAREIAKHKAGSEARSAILGE